MLKSFSRYNPVFIALALGIFAVAVLSRFIGIQSVPSAISHDEIINAFEAKSIALTGKGTSPTWTPFSLQPVHPYFAELTATMMAPFHFLPVSLDFATKLPYILISLALPVVLGIVGFLITKQKSAGIAITAISLFNPWIWQFGRLAFDPSFSLFFLWFGVLPLLVFKDWKKLLSFPLFFIAFYQYQGHKVIFLPWIVVWTAYVIVKDYSFPQRFSFSWKSLIKESKTFLKHHWPTILIVLGSALLFTYYLFVQLPTHTSKNRTATILTPTHPDIVQSVFDGRRLSLDTPLNRFEMNAYTLWGEYILDRYFHVFSLSRIFFKEYATSSPFAVWFHGSMYLLDLLFISLGVLALIKGKKYLPLATIGAALLIAPLPGVLSEEIWLIFRASMVIPLLLLLAGIGVSYCFTHAPKVVSAALLLLYILSIGHFTFLYFVRYPILAAERHYFTEKILSNYVQRIPEEKQVTVYTTEPEFTYRAHLYYTEALQKDTIKTIQDSMSEKSYILNNFKVTNDCFGIENLDEEQVAIVDRDTYICTDRGPVLWNKLSASESATLSSHLSFSAVKDSGEVYAIFQDSLCSQYELGTYLRLIYLNQLNPKPMDDQTFCRTWVTDLRNVSKTNQ